VREAEEVEGLRFPVATRSPVRSRKAAELEETRFVGMQRQPEPREAVAQFGEESVGVPAMLESDDEVVGETDDDDIAARLPPPPSLDPEVKDVVQVDVGQEGADAPTLDRADLTLSSNSVLQHARPQPLLDEARDAPVRDTVLEEADESLVVAL
jgi:hypothetical protein